MIGFREQYSICRKEGMLGQGPFQSFKDFPELLPANPRIAKLFKERGVDGIRSIACTRFGGICNSRHLKCRSLRKMDEKPAQKPEPQTRFTEGMSTFDGQKCSGHFNVTNWP